MAVRGNIKFKIVVIFILVVLAIVWGFSNHLAERAAEAEELKKWQASPEYSFRFCITTVSGINGTATADQIAACNKAAGR